MAHIFEPFVREPSLTEGTGNIVLEGAMADSIAFDDVMLDGDTANVAVSQGPARQEFKATMNASGELVRTETFRSRHANGTIDQNNVSFAPGVKTVVMVYGSKMVRDLEAGAVRFTAAQTLTDPQKRQALDNLGLFPTGTRIIFPQNTVPAGFTTANDHHNKALRIIGSGGTASSGGTLDFDVVFAKTVTDLHTLTTAQLAVHPHANTVNDPGHPHSGQATLAGKPLGDTSKLAGASIQGDYAGTNVAGTLVIPSATTGISLNNANAGSGQGHQHGMDIRVKYLDARVGIKD